MCIHLHTCPLAGLGCVYTLPSSQHRAFRSNLIYYGCFGFLTIARLWPYTGFVTGNKYENIFRSHRKMEVVVITLDMQSALLKMSSVIFFFVPSWCPYFCIKKGLSLWIGCQIFLFFYFFKYRWQLQHHQRLYLTTSLRWLHFTFMRHTSTLLFSADRG